MNKTILNNLEEIGDILDLKIEHVNGMLLCNGAYYDSFKRLVLTEDKGFDIKEKLSANRELNFIQSAYTSEPDPVFYNFEWFAAKSLSLTEENGYFRGEDFIASRQFSINTSWGTLSVNKTNVIKPIHSIESLEVGCIVLSSKRDPVLFVKGGTHLKPINSSPSKTSVVLRDLNTKLAGTKVENIYTSQMYKSLFNSCKVGLTDRIKISVKRERGLALAFSKYDGLEHIKHLRFNGLRITALIGKFVNTFSEEDKKDAVSAVIEACSSTGDTIPSTISDIIIKSSGGVKKHDSALVLFVENSFCSFFATNKTKNPVITNKITGTVYRMTEGSRVGNALKIAKRLKDTAFIKDKLENVSASDISDILLAYISSGAKAEDAEWSLDLGYAKAILDFETDNFRLALKDGVNPSMAARWMINDQWHRGASNPIVRADTYGFVFQSHNDIVSARDATYAMALAVLLRVKVTLKVFAGSSKAEKNVLRYFGSPAFNPLSLLVADADKGHLSMYDIGIARDTPENIDDKCMVSIIIVDNPDIADICMSSSYDKNDERTKLYKLGSSSPSKTYIEHFHNMVKKVVTIFPDMESAQERLGSMRSIMEYVSSLDRESIKVV